MRNTVNKTKTMSIFAVLIISVIALSGCGNRINASYRCEKSDHSYWLDFNSDGSCLFWNQGVLEGKYKWDKNQECYLLTIKSKDDSSEIILSAVPADDYIIVSGDVFYEDVFYVPSQVELNQHNASRSIWGV